MTMASRRVTPCGGCGQSYDAAAWTSLDPVGTLAPDEVRPHVVAWPEPRIIEVRACRRCGRSLARFSLPTPRSA